MDITEKFGIHNRFKVEVIDAKTKKIKQEAQGFNVVLDRLWQQLCSDKGLYFTYIFYGSGTGTPSHSDTTLFHHEGAVQCLSYSDSDFSYDHENNIASFTRKIQLNETTAVGVNFTEVGIGYGTASNNLCTHALLQDMNGNPISILKTNTDIINIYATVYIHWSKNSIFTPYFEWQTNSYYYSSWGAARIRDYLFGIRKSSTEPDSSQEFRHHYWFNGLDGGKEAPPYSVIDTYTQTRNPAALTGSGVALISDSISKSYDATNKRVIHTCSRIPIATGNNGGIGILCFNQCNANKNIPQFSLEVSAFYNGTNITGEAVGTGDGTTTEFDTKFDFPENAEIYVDGVKKTTGVIVKNIPKNTYTLGNYVRKLWKGSSVGHHQTYLEVMQNSFATYNLGAGELIFNKANEIGFSSVSNPNAGHVYGSNDLVTWTELADSGSGTVTLTGAEQNFKYYKNDGTATATLYWNANNGKAIVFDVAPESGSVITANYKTPYIAKDEDHVLDITVTFQFGEWSE